MKSRAYSLLTVKSVEEGKRIIRGVATSPTVDRVGDIVEPMGVTFKNPLPLLWQHMHDKPIGTVVFDEPTEEGITFTAELPIIEEAGALRDRIEEAWQSIKANLVRAVSIGFRAIEYAWIDDGGIRFIKTEVYELSAVTIPAQPDAVITSLKNLDAAGLELIKKFDTNAPAASGRPERPSNTAPGASGKTHKPVDLRPKEGTTMKTIAEQITALEASRATKAARMATVMQKSIDENRSTDESEQQEFDTLEQEVVAIDADIKRLKSLQKAQAATATPAQGNNTVEATSARAGVVVKAAKPEPGIRFARYARCLGLARKTGQDLMGVVEQHYGTRDPDLVGIVKAAVTAINTTTDTALIGNEGGFADFVEFLRPMTIVGRFGQGGIPSLRRVPFRVPLIRQTGGATGYWVGEGKPKPLTKPSWSRTELNPLKAANIAVATMEALRDSSPSAEMLLRDDLAAAIVAAIDTAYIDPANAGSAGVKPASITNGITAIPSSGNDAAAIREDARKAMSVFVAAENPLTSGVWIMSTIVALSLSLMRTALDQPEFPGITINGGTFMGLPVITSSYAGTNVTLQNAQDVWFGDDGEVAVDMSTEASLQMMDNPTNDSVTPTATDLVSMFQTNSVAFRAERTVNWLRRRDTGVAVISGVEWGQPDEEP
ncbi:phage major capsid protein [Devosia sp.]|uniref:phage major capsid protein n=1 Tax=Devosia sp. TaxID=1871048 RepID=UPI001B1D8E79|nr:phage major capsid protein [Devosia sp.]MBO9589074.1 phage major capsid protein [Devosia sp.]